MTTIVLNPGDRIVIQLKNTDGEFVVNYGESVLSVEADMPDTAGRVGVIYSEEFGNDSMGASVAEVDDSDEEDEEDDADEDDWVGDTRPLKLSADIREVGLWTTRYRTVTYPPEYIEWPDQKDFAKGLKAVEATLTKIRARGIETCPHCSEGGAISMYECDGWTWHGSLSHSVLRHGARPSEEFIAFIDRKSRPLRFVKTIKG